ncbi:MAG: ASCH domain-containing protein [Planctomycetaceae bacterium]|nr:ASCH domain-containing protein [Planctomycetaceae bacterium]
MGSLVNESITFKFGDSEELCNGLLRLVRSGKKTATCGALHEFGLGKDEMPIVGRRDIALNWDGSPALLLETLEVTQVRFCDVDADFAQAEGENDDLAGWRRDHRQYFERNGGFEKEMILVCERFRLVNDFGSQAE